MSVRSGKLRKPVSTEVIGDFVLMEEGDRALNSIGRTSVHHVAAAVDQPTATVHKILRNLTL